MCGIAGIFKPPNQIADISDVKIMCDTLTHRGPDDEGFYHHESCALGMRRLSIIDLETGHQPIHNEDKTIWTVFNGEIYNYNILRQELLEKGHTFYSQSDTEVIVHSYEEYGWHFLNKLNGMFSIAIYDSNKKILLIARDRLGIKQLYYSFDNGVFYFGSEIKAILSVLKRSLSIDNDAIDSYLTLLYTPSPLTIYKNVFAIKPGHFIILKEGKIKQYDSYWELKPSPNMQMTENEAIEGFRSRFEKAVERRMIADVPLGAFLSGGIDSSAVVAIMSQFSSRPVKTFSIGYNSQEGYYDEREFAKLVSNQYHTDHKEFVVTPDAKSVIPEIIRAFDQPFADSSAIPNYYINKMTRSFVTVALSGLGGDELAAGYERYLGMKLANTYQHIPRWLREKIINQIVLRLPDSKKGKRFVDQAKRFISSATLPLNSRYYQFIAGFNKAQLNNLYLDSTFSRDEDSYSWSFIDNAINNFAMHDELTRILAADVITYLVDDLLTLTDRMSMLHSLEVRVPFLDHELVEYTFSIPSKYKLKFCSKKYLLKKAFADILPNDILYRKKKGFSVPLVLWFRSSLNQYMHKVLSTNATKKMGFFNQAYINKLMDDHQKAKQNHHSRIWALIIFYLWYDQNISKIYSHD